MPNPTEPNRTVRRVWHRPRRLPATGMPVKGEGRRAGSVFSLIVHILIVLLIAIPVATHTGDVIEKELGAGGKGPAGGGGGGHRGTGGIQERVQYVAVAPPPPSPAAVVPPPVQPPVVSPPEI